jgi:hypothetical protein
VGITLSRLYDDYAAATLVLQELESIGIPASEISIVSSNAENWYSSKGPTSSASQHERDRDGADHQAEGAATGAGIGATVGGIAGLLAGLGIIAIPGIGPVVAAGWLASTAVFAAAGGVAGGILGALTEVGVSEEMHKSMPKESAVAAPCLPSAFSRPIKRGSKRFLTARR